MLKLERGIFESTRKMIGSMPRNGVAVYGTSEERARKLELIPEEDLLCPGYPLVRFYAAIPSPVEPPIAKFLRIGREAMYDTYRDAIKQANKDLKPKRFVWQEPEEMRPALVVFTPATIPYYEESRASNSYYGNLNRGLPAQVTLTQEELEGSQMLGVIKGRENGRDKDLVRIYSELQELINSARSLRSQEA